MPSKADSPRSLSGQACDEADKIASVVQLLVIDWRFPVENEVRSIRKIGLPCFTRSATSTSTSAATASNLYSASIKRMSYLRSRSEMIGSTFKVVGDDLPANLQGKLGLIEGDGDAIRQTHATNSDDAPALCQLLRQLGHSNECAFATANLDQTSAPQDSESPGER
jgi:hypothetical protein